MKAKKICRLFIVLILFILLHASCSFSLVIHRLSGSDLGMGIGARAVSLGGAFVALADDASAMFWNPAGLPQLKQNELSFMGDMPDELSYSALVLKPKDDEKQSIHFRIGVAVINRLRYRAEGDWGNSGFASHLIELSMINVEKNYVGGIDSKTVDRRVSIAVQKGKVSLGINAVAFRCLTNFYNEGQGRLCQLVSYNTYDLGALIKLNDVYSVGLMYRNVQEPSKPKYFTIGFAKRTKNARLMIDGESIFGKYGEVGLRKASFFMLRMGYERKLGKKLTGRIGLIIPLKAWTSTLGNLIANLPPPKFGGSGGIGYALSKNADFDLAIFGDPGRSYIQKKLVISASASVRYRF